MRMRTRSFSRATSGSVPGKARPFMVRRLKSVISLGFGREVPGSMRHSESSRQKSRSDPLVGRRKPRVDDEHPQQPQTLLGHAVVMGVVHEGAALAQRPLVPEGLARRDGALGETAHSVHAARQVHAVPVHGGGRGQPVGDVNTHPLALDRLDDGGVHTAAVAPALGPETRGKFMVERLGHEMEHLHAVDDLEGQRGPVRNDHRLVIFPWQARRQWRHVHWAAAVRGVPAAARLLRRGGLGDQRGAAHQGGGCGLEQNRVA